MTTIAEDPMTRRITLAIVTDESGTKCAPECPHHDYVYIIGGHPDFVDAENPAYSVCEWDNPHAQRPQGKQPLNIRTARCLAAEQAAIEADVAAVKRGYDLRDEYDADDMDADLAPHALAHVIERIRGGK